MQGSDWKASDLEAEDKSGWKKTANRMIMMAFEWKIKCIEEAI